MGIKNINRLIATRYPHIVQEVTYTDLVSRNAVVVVDASYFLNVAYRAVKEHLTSPDGRQTSFLVTFESFIRDIGVHNSVWVFDSSSINPAKIEEIERREESREERLARYEADLAAGTSSTIASKATERLPRDIIDTTRAALDCFGIPWIEAPVGVEAEALAAALTHCFDDAVVYSADTDCIPFNATAAIHRQHGKFRYIDIATLIATHGETVRREAYGTPVLGVVAALCDLVGVPCELNDLTIMRRTCLALGCDWNVQRGVRGIGPATVIKKYRTAVATMDGSLLPCYDTPAVNCSFLSDNDYVPIATALANYNALLVELGFDVSRIEKQHNRFVKKWNSTQRYYPRRTARGDIAPRNIADIPFELQVELPEETEEPPVKATDVIEFSDSSDDDV